MSLKTLTATVTPETAGRVDLIVRTLTGMPRSQVRGLVDHGCVAVNKAACTSDFQPVAAGDTVVVAFDPHRKYHEKPKSPEDAPFRVLFEDDRLLVVEKAAHLLTVPTLKHETDTLVHLLQQHVSRGRRGLRRVEVVHRLDRGVSGVLVFAKDNETANRLRDQFAASKPEREYTAIVAGRMEADSGTFDKSLVTDEATIHRRVAPSPELGERAVTHYQVVRRFKDATLVRVHLETGRRNQIRVHFADAGHPVLNDPRYESDRAKNPRWPWRRMALHATTLVFAHPHAGRTIRCEAPPPPEFAKFAGDAPLSPSDGGGHMPTPSHTRQGGARPANRRMGAPPASENRTSSEPGHAGKRAATPGHTGGRVSTPGHTGGRVSTPGHTGRRVSNPPNMDRERPARKTKPWEAAPPPAARPKLRLHQMPTKRK